jgi:aspartate carbamoyltransferase catalytic subunit
VSTRAKAPSSKRPRTNADSEWAHRHLLQLHGLKPSELRAILTRARTYARGLPASLAGTHDASVGGKDFTGVLEGKVIANLFFEDSTRTRVSFSVAAARLGARVIDLTSVGSSVSKGETIGDTALNVAAIGVDAMVIRHRSSGAPHLVVRTLEGRHQLGMDQATRPNAASIINAGDGRHEHPTQGLLDIYTLASAFDRLDSFDLSGLTVVILGDIGSSRVARSGVVGMTALGAKVICVGPPSLVPAGFKTLGCEVTHDLDSVIEKADALNVLRIQFERHEVKNATDGHNKPVASSSAAIASIREYHELYGINQRRATRMKKNAIIMHPGPINRGVELTPEVADSGRSMVLHQVAHGVGVRMAALSLCLGA